MPNRASRHQVANLLMLVTTSCWAGNIVAGKKALLGFAPLALAQLRVIGAALLLGGLLALRRRQARLPSNKGQWLLLACLALTGVTLNQLCFISGLARTSALHAGLIIALGPVMVLVLSVLKRQESFTLARLCGMLMSFTGVALLLTQRSGLKSGGHWLGDLTVLAGTAAFAYYTILVKQIAGVYDDLTLNALVFGIGAVLMVPLAARATFAMQWHGLPGQAWLGLAYMVVFGSVVAYVIFGFALSQLPASRVAAFSYLQPVMAAALAVWLVSERITVKEIGGGVLILAGMYLTRERFRRLAHGGVQSRA